MGTTACFHHVPRALPFVPFFSLLLPFSNPLLSLALSYRSYPNPPLLLRLPRSPSQVPPQYQLLLSPQSAKTDRLAATWEIAQSSGLQVYIYPTAERASSVLRELVRNHSQCICHQVDWIHFPLAPHIRKRQPHSKGSRTVKEKKKKNTTKAPKPLLGSMRHPTSEDGQSGSEETHCKETQNLWRPATVCPVPEHQNWCGGKASAWHEQRRSLIPTSTD